MRPRIVSVCLDLSPSHGGMYRAVTDLARILDSPIVSFRDGSGKEPPNVKDVPVSFVDWSNLSVVRQAFFPPAKLCSAAENAIGSADCLVVHSLFRAHAQIVHRIAAIREVPYVIVPHGALEPALWRSKRMLRRAWMLAGGAAFLRDAARIVFASEGELRHAGQTLGGKPFAEVIPFAVDAIDPPFDDTDRSAARKQLGLPLKRRLLLVLGRLDPVKRPREIVRWFCAANVRDCDLVIAGMDGAITKDHLMAELPADLLGRVWFLGGLEAARRDMALAACDGYLSWSRHESFGYAAAESMAAGLPVILPPGHGLRSEIDGIDCGVFPIRDDEPAFRAAVQEFAECSARELRQRGALGRKWVGQALNSQLVAKKWQDLIAALA